MKKYRIPAYLVLFLIIAGTLWYFGHHRPKQKILKVEPTTVYGTKSPVMPNVVQGEQDHVVDSSKQETREVEKDVKAKNMSNSLTPKPSGEKVDIGQRGDTSSEELAQEAALSDEEVKAYEAYFTAESEYIAVQEKAKEALKTGDQDQIKLAYENLKNNRLQRNEALQNLAVYSEEAVKILTEITSNESMADEIIGDPDQESVEFNIKILEKLEQFPLLRDLLIKHGYLSLE